MKRESFHATAREPRIPQEVEYAVIHNLVVALDCRGGTD